MSQPKGKISPHIKSKKFQHSEATNRVVIILYKVEDPREPFAIFITHWLQSSLFL